MVTEGQFCAKAQNWPFFSKLLQFHIPLLATEKLICQNKTKKAYYVV
jgi:hypothetical protein